MSKLSDNTIGDFTDKLLPAIFQAKGSRNNMQIAQAGFHIIAYYPFTEGDD